ncbi:MAG: CAP domain-containing protein, partial [Acidobacteriota bacterium]|nr:CAP domain-containing protein [Acidobacteriota bacterium]
MALVLLLLRLVGGLAGSGDFRALSDEFLAAINAERARAGAPPLSLSPPLKRVAQDLADSATRRGDTDLTPPGERELVGRVENA